MVLKTEKEKKRKVKKKKRKNRKNKKMKWQSKAKTKDKKSGKRKEHATFFIRKKINYLAGFNYNVIVKLLCKEVRNRCQEPT